MATLLQDNINLQQDEFLNIVKELVKDYDCWPIYDSNLYSDIFTYIFLGYHYFGMTDEALDFFNSEYKEYEKNVEYAYNYKSAIFHTLARIYLSKGDENNAEKSINRYAYYALQSNISYSDFEYASFRTISEYVINDLKNNTFSLSHPKHFNDLWDPLLLQWYETIKENTEDDFERRFIDLQLKCLGHMRIRCFSRDSQLPKVDRTNLFEPPKEPYTKELNIENLTPTQWCFYADNHKGLCIKYKFPSSFVLNNDKERGSWTLMGNMNYDNPIEDISSEQMDAEKALFYKADVYRNENEVRLIHFDPNITDDFISIPLPPGCVKAIYFGAKCLDEHINIIKKVVDNTVELFKMKPDTKRIGKFIAEKIN